MCVDGTPGDGTFTCLCTKGWTTGASVLCDVSKEVNERALNSPSDLSVAAATAQKASEEDDDNAAVVVLGILVAITVCDTCIKLRVSQIMIRVAADVRYASHCRGHNVGARPPSATPRPSSLHTFFTCNLIAKRSLAW